MAHGKQTRMCAKCGKEFTARCPTHKFCENCGRKQNPNPKQKITEPHMIINGVIVFLDKPNPKDRLGYELKFCKICGIKLRGKIQRDRELCVDCQKNTETRKELYERLSKHGNNMQ